MRAYLVGGAVRNALLGRKVEERDFVVVGSTPEDMAAAGYRPVGKDFPVFLHPQTGEEYALARTERKTGRGYKGFSFNASPDVTLEEDLLRRDFTVNAMARDPDTDEIIDPHGGRNDCAARTLRHVSDAFAEDPLRVLRAARFASELCLAIAPQTEELIRVLVASGELHDLQPERVFQELGRGLGGSRPSAFISYLRRWDAMQSLLPEVEALFGVPQRPETHPEGCAGVHTMRVLDVAAANFWGLDVRLAALLHDAGKAATPADQLPRHPGHEKRSAEIAAAACDRLRMPKAIKAGIVAAAAEHGVIHDFERLSAADILDLFMRTGALRGSPSFECVLALATCDHGSHPGRNCYALHPAWWPLRRMLAAAAGIDGKAAAAAQDDPAAGVRAARLAAIEAARTAA